MSDSVQKDIGNADCAVVGLWTEDNYGTVLTAWSLYKALERLGCHPVLVDQMGAGNRDTLRGQFIRNRCCVTKPYQTVGERMELNDFIDTFIVGSDQNWHDGWLEKNKGFLYFLDFVEDSKRKISYAASFGNNDYKGVIEELDVVKFYLQRFDAISMREKGAAKLWSEILHRDIMCAIDPVFLTSADEYKEIAKIWNGGHEAGCFLEMLLDASAPLIESGREASKVLNADFDLFLGPDFTICDDTVIDWDRDKHPVEEFLARISDAEYILTDSFHVMCFAIIFHKPFVCVANTRGRARIESVLGVLGMEEKEYLIEPEGLRNFDWNRHFNTLKLDWDELDRKLQVWKEESMEWLKTALNCRTAKTPLDKDRLLAEVTNLAAMGNRNAANALNILGAVCWEIGTIKKSLIATRSMRLRKYLAAGIPSNSSIAIRGGGEHTRRLLMLMEEMIEEKNLCIKYIVDRSRELKLDIPETCEVILPDAFWSCGREVDIVIISSSKYKKELIREVDDRNQERYQIINPYDVFVKEELLEEQAWFD